MATITAEPLRIVTGISARLDSVPFVPIPSNNKTFNCYDGLDLYNKVYGSLLVIEVGLSGQYGNTDFAATALGVLVSLQGAAIPGTVIHADPLTVHIDLFGEFFAIANKRNWVAWSHIGSISLNYQDLVNDAGERPMPFTGWVYNIKQFNKSAVVYGENGVALLYPVKEPMPTFGLVELHKEGIISKNACVDAMVSHFFIDKLGQLCQIEEKDLLQRTPAEVKVLGYAEFLLPMVANGQKIVMSYNPLRQHIYICNGTIGYIYTKQGLGQGFSNITGIAHNSFFTPDGLVPDPMAICTDIVDFGTRELKTISWVKVATDVTENVAAALDYRYKANEPFKTTAWKLVNNLGDVYFGLTALEFRVRVKLLKYAYCELDYLQISVKNTDRRFTRGPISGGNTGGN